MPKPLDETAISSLIQQAIVDSGAQGMPDMGKVMALLRPQAQGRADMALASQQLKACLSS
ncbi:GatB/YqeY domain-containing protein [Pseudomonas sp. 2FE]|uniref:GatB/YqeY domain-containing protein n=1 Tax=Pseudomonas sp. 2FE TaxID=2502190 RepID=UPI0021139535|nr:GatB/YqeY domain-containing protein [Pseudomonas sp. 2FE]